MIVEILVSFVKSLLNKDVNLYGAVTPLVQEH